VQKQKDYGILIKNLKNIILNDMGVIYLRTNLVNGMQYVGQTVDFKKRESAWKCIKWVYANKLLTEDRNKYGLENFKTEILEECDDSKLDELEIYYVDKLNTIYPNGYNDNEGGSIGFHHSEETKKKISESNKGKHFDKKGISLSEEHKHKISNSLKGRIPTNAIEAHAENSGMKVYQYTLDDEFVAEYSKIREAARKTNLNFNGIRNCCIGGFFRKGKWVNCYKYKGYKWSYQPL